jgi:hypothetical protein
MLQEALIQVYASAGVQPFDMKKYQVLRHCERTCSGAKDSS